MLRHLSLKLLLIVWVTAIVVSLLFPKEIVNFYWKDTRVITWPTLVWIAVCLLAFWAGSFVERTLYVNRGSRSINLQRSEDLHFPIDKLHRSLRISWIILSFSGLVTFTRFIWAAFMAGGIRECLTSILVSQAYFKKTYWDATNIHGIGILADLVVCTTIFSFAAVALVQKYREGIATVIKTDFQEAIQLDKLYGLSVITLTYSLILQAFYLLVSSERMAFIGGFLGGLIAYLFIRRRIRLRQFGYAGIILIIIWVFVEASRRQILGMVDLSTIFNFGKIRFLLYFTAGVRNIDSIVNHIPDRTWGWFTFRFLLSPFKLDELIALPQTYYGYNTVNIRPGLGAIPLFGILYADYGVSGLWYFMLLGFIYEKLHRKAIIQNNFLAIQIYSYCLAALLVSFVVFLPSLSRFWINILGLLIINKTFSR